MEEERQKEFTFVRFLTTNFTIYGSNRIRLQAKTKIILTGRKYIKL